MKHSSISLIKNTNVKGGESVFHRGKHKYNWGSVQSICLTFDWLAAALVCTDFLSHARVYLCLAVCLPVCLLFCISLCIPGDNQHVEIGTRASSKQYTVVPVPKVSGSQVSPKFSILILILKVKTSSNSEPNLPDSSAHQGLHRCSRHTKRCWSISRLDFGRRGP